MSRRKKRRQFNLPRTTKSQLALALAVLAELGFDVTYFTL